MGLTGEKFEKIKKCFTKEIYIYILINHIGRGAERSVSVTMAITAHHKHSACRFVVRVTIIVA